MVIVIILVIQPTTNTPNKKMNDKIMKECGMKRIIFGGLPAWSGNKDNILDVLDVCFILCFYVSGVSFFFCCCCLEK